MCDPPPSFPHFSFEFQVMAHSEVMHRTVGPPGNAWECMGVHASCVLQVTQLP